MPPTDPTTPDNPARAPAPPRALLTLRPNGRASFNREASRVLPAAVATVRFARPLLPRARWLLLPDVSGGVPVNRRRDRLGSLHLTAYELATYAFAIWPRGTTHLVFELVPWGERYFTLRLVAARPERSEASLPPTPTPRAGAPVRKPSRSARPTQQ